jgi:hypothetical protein
MQCVFVTVIKTTWIKKRSNCEEKSTIYALMYAANLFKGSLTGEMCGFLNVITWREENCLFTILFLDQLVPFLGDQ